MKIALLVLGLTAAASATIVPIRGEAKVADATFLQRQKQVLDLYVGLSHSEYFQNEFSDIDLSSLAENYGDQNVIKYFVDSYKHGFLPVDGVFTLSCKHTRKQTTRLFDIFFFAKDFDTFYKAASWARRHVNPSQFAYAYTLALIHREDSQQFTLPPLYEVFPNYFTPEHVLHSLFDDRLYGVEQRRYEYNNTGYEYNYHTGSFGGPLSLDAFDPHLEYKISYFREDVGNNAYYAMWQLRYPAWMCPEKYKKSHWFRRGESFYYTHQQIFARYNLERLANALPYVEPLYWDKPIKTGYNPRISHVNGAPFYTRPDNLVPSHFNPFLVKKAKAYEDRIYEAVDEGGYWDPNTTHLVSFENDDGIEHLGKMVYGAIDRPHRKYFGPFFYSALEAVAYAVKTGNERNYVGGALSSPVTALRDPAFYNLLNRINRLFNWHKKQFHPYHKEELGFPGVSVENFEISKLVTFFDHFDYEITNALPVKEKKEYNKLKFFATQYRLNHKPFTYKFAVKSDKEQDGIVRVFIGPKYDSQERLLTLEQKRLLMVEIDRFPVKLAAGENKYERSSKESPVFAGDYEGFRQIYDRVENSIKNQEPFYIHEKISCGAPKRFQLPHGWHSGLPYTLAIVVSPFEKKFTEDVKNFYATCGSTKLYDYRPLGFPFDRGVHEYEFKVPNIIFQDVVIYHREEKDINRATED